MISDETVRGLLRIKEGADTVIVEDRACGLVGVAVSTPGHLAGDAVHRDLGHHLSQRRSHTARISWLAVAFGAQLIVGGALISECRHHGRDSLARVCAANRGAFSLITRCFGNFVRIAVEPPLHCRRQRVVAE